MKNHRRSVGAIGAGLLSLVASVALLAAPALASADLPINDVVPSPLASIAPLPLDKKIPVVSGLNEPTPIDPKATQLPEPLASVVASIPPTDKEMPIDPGLNKILPPTGDIDPLGGIDPTGVVDPVVPPTSHIDPLSGGHDPLAGVGGSGGAFHVGSGAAGTSSGKAAGFGSDPANVGFRSGWTRRSTYDDGMSFTQRAFRMVKPMAVPFASALLGLFGIGMISKGAGGLGGVDEETEAIGGWTVLRL